MKTANTFSDDDLPGDGLHHPEIVVIPKLLLTYKEASQVTGISVAMLESLVSQGRIQIAKIDKMVRFRTQDLRSFADKHLMRKNQGRKSKAH